MFSSTLISYSLFLFLYPPALLKKKHCSRAATYSNLVCLPAWTQIARLAPGEGGGGMVGAKGGKAGVCKLVMVSSVNLYPSHYGL